MRTAALMSLLFFVTLLNAQTSPWESVAPAGSVVYSDLKEAAKNASVAYRLELSGPEVFLDKKTSGKIASLTSLMALRLSNNELFQLPSSLLSLNTLVYLSSAGNPLTGLSDSLGMLGNLRYFELANTKFDTIPEGIYGLPRLQSLAISANTDTLCFTGSLKYWAKTLTELRIYNTVLDSIPGEFTQLARLNKLVLYKCRLDSLPAVVYPLGQLSELWLDSNQITVIPSAIANMQGLTYLSLRGNRITKITSSICFLKNLVVLDLRGNPLDPYDVKIVEALLPDCRVLF